MGSLELFNLIFSTIFGSIMKLWANKQEDNRAEREFYLNTIKEQGKQKKDVREYEGVPVTEQNRIKKTIRKFYIWGKSFGWEFSSNDSGKYKASTGFHITRRIIALSCVFSIIVLPIILPTFANVSVTFGYIENSWSLLPFVNEVPVVKWITVGDAVKNIIITPLQTNVIISIISLFFGSEIVKKN